MKDKTNLDMGIFQILDEIENKINIEKCWLEILKVYCNYNENCDIHCNLILDAISECNKELFELVDCNAKNFIDF